MATPSKNGEPSHRPNSKVVSSSRVALSSRALASSTSHASPSQSIRKEPIPSVAPPAYQSHVPPHKGHATHLQQLDKSTSSSRTTVARTSSKPRTYIEKLQSERVGTSLRADGSHRPSNSMYKPTLPQNHHRGTSLIADGSQWPPSSMHKPPLSRGPAMSRPPTKHPLAIRSMAPPSTKSILTHPEDFQFALRQTKIESMIPEEREKQEEWAQSLIQRSGVCPEGYTWRRMPGGYQCNGGGHAMTDELLAEGMAGLYTCRTKKWGIWDGPWYPSPNGKGFVRGEGYTDEHVLHN